MKKKQIKLLLILPVFLLSLISNGQENSLEQVPSKWKFQVEESEISFKIGNMYLLSVKGDMPITKGIFNNSDNIIEINVVIDPSLLKTGIKRRDEHLKSEDFFNTDRFPQIKFISSQFSENNTKGKFKYSSQGELTIKDIEKVETIFFNVEKLSEGKIIITGEAAINRLNYGINYEMAGMGDEATVKFEIIAVKK